MADVTYVRPELADAILDYVVVDDCCAGQRKIKSKNTTYLPYPGKVIDDQQRINERYANYIGRANFINFTGWTKKGLSGLVFNKPPTVSLPPRMAVIERNVDGSGLNLTQFSKNIVDLVLRKGRSGLLVDYPITDRIATVADLERGDIRPSLLHYSPEDVTNWDYAVRGGKVYNTLIVLRETYQERKAGDFEIKIRQQYRVLELVEAQTGNRVVDRVPDNAIYRQQIWRKSGPEGGGTWEPGSPTFPRDAQGQYLTEIPFTFIGATSNSYRIDDAPLIHMANINLAHYRNSADYEESVFLIGQPTPWATGLTEDWIKRVLGGAITLGSRSALLLEPGSQVGLLQAEPNMLAGEAMKDKFEQAQKIGAKFVEKQGTMKTATEASSDNAAENSMLGDIANNVEMAIKFGLEWAGIFTGDRTQNSDAKDDSIKYELNKKFDVIFLSANDRAQLLAEYQANVITFSEYRDNLRRAGLFLMPDNDAEKEIDEQMKENLDFEVERNKLLAAEAQRQQKAGGTTNPSGSKQAA